MRRNSSHVGQSRWRPQGLTTVFLGLLLACAGCGGGGGTQSSGASAPATDTSAAADISLLFMGNSHTANHDVPGQVAAMVRAGRPGKTVLAVTAPGSMFLDERLADAASTTLLRSRAWSAVVLQAQKVSASGLFSYSTTEAAALVQMARGVGAVPVMFPEWPRYQVAETQRIFELHVSIAAQQPACVPPIGQAWDLAAARWPVLALHDSDGNHANAAGAYLAALVLYTTLTGLPPGALPVLANANVDETTQRRLQAVASDAVAALSPRLRCPGDRLL